MKMKLTAAVMISALALNAGQAHAQTPPKLTQTALTELPDIKPGDFDQFAADKDGNRLFLSGENFASMLVFDLNTGALIKRGGDVGSPHKVIFDPSTKHLFVADGKESCITVLDEDLNLVSRIPVGEKPDTGVFDDRRKLFYVGSKVSNNGVTTSTISVISTAKMTVLKTIPIEATTLKGMILDARTNTLYVSLRDKNQIAVVNLADDSVKYWSPEGLHMSVPLALDPAHHQLYAGSRKPGQLQVLDSRTGQTKATLPSTETSDAMFYDGKAHILYVSGDDGLSTYAVAKNGSATLIGTDSAIAGKSSLLLPELGKLYVAHPNKSGKDAALEVYSITY